MGKAATIFVCVKVRKGGKPSCGGCGARPLLDQFRAKLSTNSEHILIHPSGCLKRCEKGPAVVVFSSTDEPLRRPPKKAWKRADAKFKRVSPDQIKGVLEAVKDLLGKKR